MYNDLVKISPSIEGHVRIWEEETGKVLLDKHNAIHPENMSYIISQALCWKDNGHIAQMCFGNGGAKATSSNKFIYSEPQVLNPNADLYNLLEDLTITLTEDNFTISHASGTSYSDIIIDATIESSDPEGQPVTNTESSITSNFTFSEIGLKAADGTLLTHICHFPIQKAQNITLRINYLLRIMVA